VRFNRYDLSNGADDDLGARTTIWIGHYKPRPETAEFAEVYYSWVGDVNIGHRHAAVKAKCEEVGTPFFDMPTSSINKAYDEIGFEHGGVPKPTTGFVGICHFLFQTEVDSLSILGFDNYTLGHWYNDDGPCPSNCHDKHRPLIERKKIEQWINSKKLLQIDA